jgi:hypothetical protein
MVNHTLSFNNINKNDGSINILFVIGIPLLNILLCFISMIAFNYHFLYNI